jgi:hypothetical protein
MRQGAVAAHLLMQALEPPPGIARFGRAGGLAIRLLYAHTRYQGEHERHDLCAGVMQVTHRGIEIQAHGAATAIAASIRTNYALAYRPRLGADTFFIDVTVRHQLHLSTMGTWLAFQLPGLQFDGGKVDEVDVHDGAGKKSRNLASNTAFTLGA